MFKNGQWAVTDYGLECLAPDSPYEIEADRLTEVTTRGDDSFYDWPVHMAEKEWVSIVMFNEAFEHALQEHKGQYSDELDQEMLDASFAMARRIAGRRG